MYEVIKDKFLYYFAYGANMNQNQILKRCLRPEFISAAFLPHHKLEFFGYSTLWNGGVETLISDKTQDLWGVVYKLSFFDIERLDTWQNVKFDGTGPYFSSPETVFDQNGKAYPVLLYK
jgi:gamma-glutamylcyclotransferase